MKKSSVMMGIAVSSLLMATGCATRGAGGSSAVMGQCVGVNSCKGTGECGGKTHGCAGKNACKGKGWVKMSKEDCMSKGGEYKKIADAYGY